MITSTDQKRYGVKWLFWKQLDDLDFAVDLAPFSHTQHQIQENTNMLADNSTRLGLTINRWKSDVF